MTTDLRAQLRELGAVMDDEQGPLTADDIRPPVRPVVTDSPIALPLAGSRRWRIAVAAGAAVLVLAGGVALLLRVTDAPVATTSPTEPASLGAWTRISNDDGVFGGEGGQGMLSVTTGGPGFVAVGWDGTEGAAYRAPVWTSVDGQTWSRIPHDPAIFGSEPDSVLWGVTAGGPGLVAVGSAEDHVAAVWTSVDGITWSRVPHDAAVFPPGWIKSVTAGGPGLVAVGTGEDYEAAVWTSADGITWSRVLHDPAVFGGADNEVSINSVTAGGPGLVAVGEAPSGSGWVYAAVWTSVDGEIWSRVPHDAAFGETGVQAMSSVAAGPSGLVAVGRDAAKGAAAVWTSPDGLTWARVPNDPVFGRETTRASSAEMRSVTAGGPGFVAVGSRSLGSPDARVWTSVDGITWIRGDGGGFGVAEMTGVAAGGSGVVAVGAARNDTDFELDASVWLAAIED